MADVDDRCARSLKNRATSSNGRTVAERPIRCGRRPLSRNTRSSRRASVSARCEPRLSPAIAWISSTITVVTPAKSRARLLGRQQYVERLRRRDQHVRRLAQHLLALRGGRVAGAHRRANWRERRVAIVRQGDEAASGFSRFSRTSLVKRLERRDVDDERPIGQRSTRSLDARDRRGRA